MFRAVIYVKVRPDSHAKRFVSDPVQTWREANDLIEFGTASGFICGARIEQEIEFADSRFRWCLCDDEPSED